VRWSVDPSDNSVGRVFSHQGRSKAVVKIGDRFRRPPRGCDPNYPLIEDLKLKDFLARTNLSEKLACSADFIDRFQTGLRSGGTFCSHLEAGRPSVGGKETPIPRIARAAIHSSILSTIAR
jgi:hypothetical protein